jgi:hypothetical protein
MGNTVRWSLVVSRDTDIFLRTFLAQKGMRKGDLSKFVEGAVRWRVLDRVVAETKTKNAGGVSTKKLEAAVDKAVHSVRAQRLKRKA